MKTHFYLLCLALFVANVAQAQSKFGKVTHDELAMTAYPADSAANAVFLLKNGETKFIQSNNNKYKVSHTVHTKIKILTEEGAKLAKQRIRHQKIRSRYKEEVSNLTATTYNIENGKVVQTKMDKKEIWDENTGGHTWMTHFTLPNVRIGSIIEFSYTLVSDRLQQLPPFEFQGPHPIESTSLTITVPEVFSYHFNMSGYAHIAKKEKGTSIAFIRTIKDKDKGTIRKRDNKPATEYSFEGANIPALTKEPYMPNPRDFAAKLTAELRAIHELGKPTQDFSTSWEAVDKTLLKTESIRSGINKNSLFKNEITTTEATIENAHNILNLVKSKVKWNKVYSIYPMNMDKALSEGRGNAADINVLLLNALKGAGFDAYPVFLSTRNWGILPNTHPTINAFSYIIVAIEIEGKRYFGDATDPYTAWNILPKRAIVSQARLLRDKQSEWCSLLNLVESQAMLVSQIKFEDDKRIASRTDKYIGNYTSPIREIYATFDNDVKFISKMINTDDSNISSIELKGMDETNQPILVSFTKTTDQELGAKYIYINPMIKGIYPKNPFVSENRVLPVAFSWVGNHTHMLNILIPEGYELENLPKDDTITLNNNDIIMTCQFTQNGQEINCKYDFQMNKIFYIPSEYADLRHTFEQIAEKNQLKIVLKKKDAQ